MRWVWTGGIIGLAAALIGLGIYLSNATGAGPRTAYAQSTPDEVLQSAWTMVEKGEAFRLSDLLYAESDEMRSVLNRLGGLLGSLQRLAGEIQKRFPEEVAALRTKAEQNAGKGGGLASLLRSAQGGAGARGDARRDGGRDMQLQMTDTLQLLLADPYSWLASNRARLTTVMIADDTAAVMVDGKPALGLGLTMKRDHERWQIVLPLNLPFVSKFLPRSRDEYAILVSMIQVIDNAIVELDSDVRAGKAKDLTGVAEQAGEKAWMPMAICFVAYQRAMEARDHAK